MQMHQIVTSQQIEIFIQACENQQRLSETEIRFLDQLTVTHSKSYDQQTISICHQLWERVGHINNFWDNVNLILTQAIHQSTTLQALILIHQRIKLNWPYESETVRESVKANMCEHAKKYYLCQVNPQYKSQFRKINAIITQILKYEWSGKWSGFLFEIFQAISSEEAVAENYFDLIKCVFEEIFRQNQRLTSGEIKKITNIISNNFPNIGRVFQQYMTVDQHPGILKNCLQALSALIPYLPPSAVYFHFAFDEMIVLLKIPDFSMIVLSCFCELFCLKNDQGIQNLKQKIHGKKQVILINILKQLRLDSPDIFKIKVIEIACHVLKQSQQSSSAHNISSTDKKWKLAPNQDKKENKTFIVSKILQIAQSLHEKQFALRSMFPYSQMTKLITSESIPAFIRNLVSITVNPLDTQFYSMQKIFRSQDECTDSQNKQNFFDIRMILRLLIGDEQTEQQYEAFIFTMLDKKIQTLESLQQFCQVCWNFYQYLFSCSHALQKIYSLTNLLCILEEDLRNEISNSKKMNMIMSKTLLVLRANMMLILSHPKSLKSSDFKNIYLTFVCKSFTECSNFIIFAFDTLEVGRQFLTSEDLKLINQRYTELTNMRANRIVIDEKYVKFLVQWIVSRENMDSHNGGCYENNNSSQGNRERNLGTSSYRKIQHIFVRPNNQRALAVQHIEGVFISYRKKFNQLRTKKIRITGDNSLKCRTVQIGLKILRLYKSVLQNISEQILSKENAVEQLKILFKLCHTCQQIKQIREVEQFFRLAMQVQTILLDDARLSNESIKNFSEKHSLLGIIMQNMNFQLDKLEVSAVGKESEQKFEGLVIRMCSRVIRNLQKYGGHQNDKINTLTIIIMKVNQICVQTLTDNYLQFLMSIFTSKYLDFVEGIHLSKLLFYIFDFADSDNQSHVIGAHRILISVLTNLLEKANANLRIPLDELILSILTQTFAIAIRNRLNDQYIGPFCEILSLNLDVIRGIKGKFCEQQSLQNMQFVFQRLTQIVQKQYSQIVSSTMLNMISILKSIIQERNKQDEFTQNFKDFLVVLKRGYI